MGKGDLRGTGVQQGEGFRERNQMETCGGSRSCLDGKQQNALPSIPALEQGGECWRERVTGEVG